MTDDRDNRNRTLDEGSGPHAGQPLVTAGAPAMAAEAAIVCCHGRGATAQGVVNLLEPVYRHGVAVLAPQAERSRWYPNPTSAPRDDNEPWLTSGVESVAAAVDAAREIDVPYRRLFVGGFSQGACVACEFVRRNPRRYGGLWSLSGALPGARDEDVAITSGGDGNALDGTRVLVGYGEDDPYLDPDRIAETVRVFADAGGVVDERAYPDTGHEVTDDEFDAMGAMVDRALADVPEK